MRVGVCVCGVRVLCVCVCAIAGGGARAWVVCMGVARGKRAAPRRRFYPSAHREGAGGRDGASVACVCVRVY